MPQRGCQVTNFCAFSMLTGLAGFVIEDDFVLGAVILEHAEDILHPRHCVKEGEEDRHADDAIGHVEGDASREHGIDLLELSYEQQGNELVQE